jgi:hypothetical protein
MTAFFGHVATQLVLVHGHPQWFSYQQVPLLTVFVGMLSFYLSLRNVLDDQDESTKDSQ